MYSAALTLTTPSGPLPVQPGVVAWFTLDGDPDGAKVIYGAVMDASFGLGRARFEFPDLVLQQGASSGNIYVSISGYHVVSAPTRAWVGQQPPEWGTVELEPVAVPFPWPPAKRPALGPLPPGVYDQTLWFDPPAQPSKRYMRGDWWGVVVPGLPYLPGFTSLEHPERCLTWFLPRWAPQWQDAILAAHAERGHTHFGLMWEDAQLAGLTISDFITLCRSVKQTIPYLQVSLGSKGLTPRDQNPDQYWARNGVVAEALLNAGCVDEFIPGFEWNLWNVPGDWTIEIFQRLGDLGHSAGVTTGMHFSTGVTGWWSAGSNRFDFSRQMVGHIDVLNYQGDPAWDAPTYQARICDTLRDDPTYAAGLIDMRDFERDAAAEFSNDQPDEAATALRGYLMQCTRAPAHLWGYGNNGLRLDGSGL